MKLAIAIVVVPTVAAAQPYQEYRPAKSPQHATALSLIGTIAAVAATAGGIALAVDHTGSNLEFVGTMGMILGPPSLLVLPSLGHDYGEGTFVTHGLVVRAVGLGLVGGGLVLEIADNIGGLFCFNDGPCPAESNRGLVVMGIGGAVMLGGAIYDIATAGDSTERYNRSHGLAVRVMPTVLRTPEGDVAAGVGIGGKF